MKSIKNKAYAQGDTRVHSLAMTAGNMKQIIEWSEKEFPTMGLLPAAIDNALPRAP